MYYFTFIVYHFVYLLKQATIFIDISVYSTSSTDVLDFLKIPFNKWLWIII